MQRQGVPSLLIGTAFACDCVCAALSTGRTERIIAEGLTIVGWVALYALYKPSCITGGPRGVGSGSIDR